MCHRQYRIPGILLFSIRYLWLL